MVFITGTEHSKKQGVGNQRRRRLKDILRKVPVDTNVKVDSGRFTCNYSKMKQHTASLIGIGRRTLEEYFINGKDSFKKHGGKCGCV